MIRFHNNQAALCLVLEWVDGYNFRDFLYIRKTDGSFNEDCARWYKEGESWELGDMVKEHKLLIDVASGMQYVHAQRPPILHRDLKPSNILIETGILPHRAKIADFGLSVALTGASGQSLSMKVGTKRYMAPEVKRRMMHNTPADVFSYGCICVEVLSPAEVANQAVEFPALLEKLKDGGGVDLEDIYLTAQECLREVPLTRPNFTEVLRLISTQGAHCSREISDTATGTAGTGLTFTGAGTETSPGSSTSKPTAPVIGRGMSGLMSL